MECTQVIPSCDLSQIDDSLNEDQRVGRLLVPKTAECEEAEYFLKNGDNIVGRISDTSSVCINDLSVSRKHAVIRCGGAKYFHIYDVGSANGTFLESKGAKSKLVPNVRYNLCSGDKLTFGCIVATFTKDLNSPHVIDDSDSDTGSESMLPLDDDLDDIITGPMNRNQKQTILSDSEEDSIGAASCNSSTEIPSSQTAKTAEEVSPFKTPSVPAIRSSQFRSSQISSVSGSSTSESYVKTSPEDHKFKLSSSSQEATTKSDESIYDRETQVPLNDSIYDRETQRLSTSIYDASTQKVSPDVLKLSPLSGNRTASRDPRKLSANLYDSETQKAEVNPKSSEDIYSLETQKPRDDIYNMATQRPNEDIFNKETQRADEDIFSKETQRANEDIFSKETQRADTNIFSRVSRRFNEDIFSKETQKVNEDIYAKETQRVSEDIYAKETQRANEDIYSKETQKADTNIFSRVSRRFNEDFFNKKTQKVNEDIFSKETQKVNEDIYAKETQRVNEDIFDKDTQRAGEDTSIYNAETQRPDKSIDLQETQVVSKMRIKEKQPEFQEDIYNKDTQKPSEAFFSAETQKPDESLYSAQTQKLNISRDIEDACQFKTSKPHNLEQSISDMPMQKSFVGDKLSKTEIGETNDEDDAMTQIISSTPAVNTSEARKKSLSAFTKSLGKDYLGSPIGSSLNSSLRSVKSKHSKSPSSNNQSSNTSSLYSMQINSFNGGDDSDSEDAEKNSSTSKSKESEVSGNDAVIPEMNEDDLNNMLTQKINVPAKSKGKIALKKFERESSKDQGPNIDNMSTQIVETQDSSSAKRTGFVKKAPLTASALLEMSTQLLDSTNETSQDTGAKNVAEGDLNDALTQKLDGKFKSNLKSVKEDESVNDLMTQKLPSRSDDLDKTNFSKKSNYNISEMDLDDMLTQKIDTVDGVENVRKIERPIPKRTTSTPRVSTKSKVGQSSLHDVSNLDDMLTQKLPCGDKSKDVTSHSDLSMDVCQSQPLGAGKIENTDLHNVSKTSSSSFTPYKRDMREKLDIISSGDETDDDIGNFVKLSSSKQKVESAEHSPADLEVEMLCTGKETSLGKYKEPVVKEKSPASQSVIVEEDITMSPRSSLNSDPILPDKTASFFKRIPDAGKSKSLVVVKKEDDDTKSSGTVTPDDLEFESGPTNQATKIITEVLVPKSEDTTATKKGTRGEIASNDDTKSSGTATPDDLAFNSDPANNQDTKQVKEEFAPKTEEKTFAKKDARRKTELSDETKSSGTITPDDFAFDSDTKNITEVLVPKDEKASSQDPELRTETASGATKGNLRSKKGRVKNQKLSTKNRDAADSDSSEIKSPTSKPDDLATKTDSSNEKPDSGKKAVAELKTPASAKKATSRRTLKSGGESSKKHSEEQTVPVKSKLTEENDTPPTRIRSIRAKDTDGKYKMMLKGIKSDTEDSASGDKNRRGRSLAKKTIAEPEKVPEKQNKQPPVDIQTKSTRNRTISNDQSKELPAKKVSTPKPSPSKSRRDSETSHSNDDTPKTKPRSRIASPLKRSAVKAESEVNKDSSDANFKRKESVRGRSNKVQPMEEDVIPEVKSKSAKVVSKKKEPVSSRLKKAQVIGSDSEDDAYKSENIRSSRSSRATALKRKSDEDSPVVSKISTPSKQKVSESKKAKVEEETMTTDSEETLKTRTPSKRRANQTLNEIETKKDKEVSDKPTPKKRFKSSEEQETFKAPSDVESVKLEENSSTRSSRRRKPSQSEPDDVSGTDGPKSTRSPKQATTGTPKKSQRTRSDSQSSLKGVSGRRSRQVTETSSEDETMTLASSVKKGVRASRKNSTTFAEPSVKEVGHRSKVQEITRLSTRSSSQSDSDSVQGDIKETIKKPPERKSRAGMKKSVSTDASASESEDAHSTSSNKSTPAKSRVSRSVKQENSPFPKGSRLSARKLSAPMEKYRIMFTGLDEKSLAKFQNIVLSLGGIIEENPSSCTVLVTDKVRRTIKFLSTLAQGKPIVSIKWLEVSNKVNGFKDPFEYLIQDKPSEQNFDFKLSESLTKALDTPLLAGYSVFVTPSVKPEPSQMKAIIESAGGKFLSKPPAVWNENSFIISAPEDKSYWPKEKGAKFTPKIVSAEIILRGVLQQKLDLQAYLLK